MANPEESLKLYEHRIIPFKKYQGSVMVWKCLDCKLKAEDVEDYLSADCGG
jgi:hypothetical protein